MEVLHILFYLLLILISLIYLKLRQHFSYFRRHNIAYEKRNLFCISTNSLRKPMNELYREFKGKASFAGCYIYFHKAAILLDLDLVKRVLITDFNNFTNRGKYYNEKDDPLSAHLVNLEGPKWRRMRTKLTPTFTSGKMKFMFPCVIAVAERFVELLKDLVATTGTGDESLEMRELLARFTTDVIGSCAFGLECNSLRDPNAQFRVMGKKVLSQARHGRWIQMFTLVYPNLARKLGISVCFKDVTDFMVNVVKQTVELREREKVQKNDFMNLLIELKNNNTNDEGLTMEEVVAQAYIFFLAGFETSSSTMGFALYEIALHPAIQEKARREINDMFVRYNNELTYEGLNELKYLQQILYETMRKYSIVSTLKRRALHDYKIPNSSFVIERGMRVFVPVSAIHHDPEIYPNPSKFDPERFSQEEIAKRHSMAWLPFGEGPRNCIGLRFGKMQAMIGLTLLLKNFKFTLSPKTPVPLQFDETSVLLAAKGGIYLKLERVVAP